MTLAVQKIELLAGWSRLTSSTLLLLTIASLGVIGGLYLLKLLRHPAAVVQELNHPVKLNFFPLLAKTLLVLSIVFLDRSTQLSRILWFGGSGLQFIASLYILSTWLHATRFSIEHLTPAWFIPIVGSLMIPIAGVAHGFVELSWFFFAVGLLFWLVLFIVVFYRLIFHPPIVARLLPTLFILFAPPAIGFIAWSRLNGGVLDAPGRVLYYSALFLFVLIMVRLDILVRIRFFLSWWAYSFPLAALTLASVQMYHLSHQGIFKYFAFAQGTLLALVVVVLALLTVRAIVGKQICVEEG
jgi:tellurite resistance protein